MLIYIWIIIAISFANGNFLKFKFYNNLNVEIRVQIPKNNFFEDRCTVSLESNKNLLYLLNNTSTDNTTEIIIDNNNINIEYSHSTFCLLSFSPFSPYRTVVNELYNTHVISKKIMSIVPFYQANHNNIDGSIYIGASPNEKNPHAECEIVNDIWACRLSKFYFNDIMNVGTEREIKTKEIVLFSTEMVNAIYAPKEYFLYIKEKIFTPIFEKKLCSDNQYYIKCTGDEFFNFFPDMLSFVFDNGNTVSISKYKLFKKEWSVFTFQIEETDPHSYEPNVWVFGFDFMSQYTTVFDYDKKSIQFYPLPSSSLIISQSNEISIVKKIYIVNTILITIGIVIIMLFIDNKTH